jgi:hypothetical protein
MTQIPNTTGGSTESAAIAAALANESTIVTTTGTQTLTNKTLTAPSISSPTITGVGKSETKFCTTEFVAVTGTTGTTLTNVVGLTGFELIAAGVYKFELHISGVATANSGHKLGFKYTTATLTSLESSAKAFTASAVAVTQTTTATDQATLHGATTATLDIVITGRIVVNAAGTLAVQCAQNAAHADETKVYVGSYMTLTRIS